MAGQRVDLRTAAELLGISSDAVRKRAKRGTIPYETGVDGKLYVWVDGGETDDYPDEPTDRDQGALVEELRGQVAFLRRELEARTEETRRKDHIIMSLTQRGHELAPPRDEPHGTGTASEEVRGTGTPAGGTGEPRGRSWLRRLFGFSE